MLAQIATALLAFASHHKLEDAKEAPTKSVYATAGTSGAGAEPRKRCSEGQHEGMNMDKAACRAACIGTSGCTHAIHFSDNGCQISTKGCTLVSHSYGADTDEIFALPPECAQPMWKSVPSGTKDNPASGWSRMEGGGRSHDSRGAARYSGTTSMRSCRMYSHTSVSVQFDRGNTRMVSSGPSAVL